MKSLKLLLVAIFLTSTLSFAQDDLDDVFDDGDKKSMLKVGTELFTFIGGTPNVYLDFQPIDLITLQVGVGTTPFNRHMDVALIREYSSFTIKDISPGLYYSLAGKFNFTVPEYNDFNYYYYAKYKKWSYDYLTDVAVTRSKISFGAGYQIGLPGRFNLDVTAGLFIGKDRASLDPTATLQNDETIPFYNTTIHSSDTRVENRIISFELGCGLNFAL